MLTITEFSEAAIAAAPAETGPAQDGSDQALVRAIAGGDRRAMQVFYRRHNVRVYRFVLRLTNDATLAEEVVGEVFFAVWRQAAGFKSRSQVSTWLLAIARNKALSALGRRRDEQLSDDVADLIADPADDAETMIEHRDRSAMNSEMSVAAFQRPSRSD